MQRLIKTARYDFLVTTNVLNAEISEVESEIPDANSLKATTILNTKISEDATN